MAGASFIRTITGIVSSGLVTSRMLCSEGRRFSARAKCTEQGSRQQPRIRSRTRFDMENLMRTNPLPFVPWTTSIHHLPPGVSDQNDINVEHILEFLWAFLRPETCARRKGSVPGGVSQSKISARPEPTSNWPDSRNRLLRNDTCNFLIMFY
jgi:hypothetical protein